MNNRRQTYRHFFATSERRPIEVRAGARSWRGELVSLSIEGLGLRLDSAQPLPAPGRCRVQFHLDAEAPVSAEAEIVYRSDGAEPGCGVHFLPLADLNAGEARERRLAKFLIDEQVRERRRRVEKQSRGG
jgi:PilZ domain-containing protein